MTLQAKAAFHSAIQSFFDIQKHKDSSIVSCQIRINDETGARRSNQPLERAIRLHKPSPLMVF